MAEKHGSSETVQQAAGRGRAGQIAPGYGMEYREGKVGGDHGGQIGIPKVSRRHVLVCTEEESGGQRVDDWFKSPQPGSGKASVQGIPVNQFPLWFPSLAKGGVDEEQDGNP